MFFILVLILGQFLRKRVGGQNHLYFVILKLEAFQMDIVLRKKQKQNIFPSCASPLLSHTTTTPTLLMPAVGFLPHTKQFCDTSWVSYN